MRYGTAGGVGFGAFEIGVDLLKVRYSFKSETNVTAKATVNWKLHVSGNGGSTGVATRRGRNTRVITFPQYQGQGRIPNARKIRGMSNYALQVR